MMECSFLQNKIADIKNLKAKTSAEYYNYQVVDFQKNDLFIKRYCQNVIIFLDECLLTFNGNKKINRLIKLYYLYNKEKKRTVCWLTPIARNIILDLSLIHI